MLKQPVKHIIITSDQAGQRLDNFLFRELKNIPKSHIYKLLRKGEFRVNKKRAKPEYKLQPHDDIRVPPLMQETVSQPVISGSGLANLLSERILYEDGNLIIINKPAGLAVHGGSEVNFGAIEILRHYWKQYSNLELVHRLDRDTSGCLILAKNHTTLRKLHELLRTGKVQKTYQALLKGNWPLKNTQVTAPLLKNQLLAGERMVTVNETGKAAHTEFAPLKHFSVATLSSITLVTGRTHQIRVHSAHVGHPVAGDKKYGDKQFNRMMRERGLRRLFLHASAISFELDTTISVVAELDKELVDVLSHF